MGLKGQKEHFDDVAQSKEGKEMSFFFFLDMTHNKELSPGLRNVAILHSPCKSHCSVQKEEQLLTCNSQAPSPLLQFLE